MLAAASLSNRKIRYLYWARFFICCKRIFAKHCNFSELLIYDNVKRHVLPVDRILFKWAINQTQGVLAQNRHYQLLNIVKRQFECLNIHSLSYLKGLSWSWSWLYGNLQLPMQSVPINTKVVSSNPIQARCTRYNIMW